MDNKTKIMISIIVLIFLVTIGITIGIFIINKGDDNVDVDGGVVKNHRLPGYEDNIKSKDIIYFEFISPSFTVSCELKDDKLNVKSKGGDKEEKDDSYFKLDYISKDTNILKELQKVVEKYNLSKNNGYEYEVAGLPPEYGGTLSVKYVSKEKIWKYDNQSDIISKEAEKEIYELFKSNAVDNGFDFTTEGSNVELYNDADKDYVQGTWEGTHFGVKYKVIFEGTKIKIYKDDKLTNEGWYKIIDGDIVNDKPKKGVTIAKDKNDYEEFSDISMFRKKNDFTMTMYFMKESYSTDDLIKKE